MNDWMMVEMMDDLVPGWRNVLAVLALIVTVIAIVGIYVRQSGGGSLLNLLAAG